MKFKSIEPFIPSGKDFGKSKELFLALGFTVRWEAPGLAGFQRDNCKFILQDFNDTHFAENLMLRMAVSNLDEFWQDIQQNKLDQKFDIRLKGPTTFSYGREMNLIDLAGVCWHIAQDEEI